MEEGKVLDLGSGLGGNSIFLAKLGFKVTCLDNDKEVAAVVGKGNPDINTINKDILEFNFPKNEYDLVLALNVLRFFSLADIEKIIKLIIKSLKKGGLFYMKAFSTKELSYDIFLKFSPPPKEENTFYSENVKKFVHFFTKEELANFFSTNEILQIDEFVVEDDHPPEGKHKHGIITAVIRK